jgi:hypothetical protein
MPFMHVPPFEHIDAPASVGPATQRFTAVSQHPPPPHALFAQHG